MVRVRVSCKGHLSLRKSCSLPVSLKAMQSEAIFSITFIDSRRRDLIGEQG